MTIEHVHAARLRRIAKQLDLVDWEGGSSGVDAIEEIADTFDRLADPALGEAIARIQSEIDESYIAPYIDSHNPGVMLKSRDVRNLLTTIIALRESGTP